MIKLTRLNGEPVVVNPDLIETLEDSPRDVTIALTTGRRISVLESTHCIVDLVREWRQTLYSKVP